jgi:alcohol dehydrogenase
MYFILLIINYFGLVFALYDSSWLELRKFVTPEFVFGKGALSLAGRYANNFGASKVLVVSGKNVIRMGWTGKVIKSIEDHGLEYSIFSSVKPNPTSEQVMEGAEVYQKEDCDAIVVVGGGSPIDCAKGIGIVDKNQKNILDFVGVDRIPIPGPPLICVPTTAGSSADVSQFAIITNTKEKLKTAIISKMLVPDTSLVDPVTTVTMPADLTANTGLDAFTHAIEAFVSNACSPITDMCALNAMRLITGNLISAIHDPTNMGYRGKMMLGSLEAGLAFSNASLGLVHAMAHSLGGHIDLPHGESNAILLPLVIKFNYDAVPRRYEMIGETMGLDLTGLGYDEKKTRIINAIKNFQEEAGTARKLGQLGVTKGDIPELARKALKDACLATNPRIAKLEDIIAIYEEAL